DAALLEMPHSPPANIVLANLVDLDRRHHPGKHALALQGVLDGERIDHGCEHSHLVSGDSIDAGRRQPHAAKDIAAADYDRDLDTGITQVADFVAYAVDHRGIDPVVVVAHERFAAEFDQDSAETQRSRGIWHLDRRPVRWTRRVQPCWALRACAMTSSAKLTS